MQKIILLLTLIFSTFYSFSQAPKADFTATPLEICVGESITFTSTSTPGGAPITKYDWDFGDGSAGNSAVSNHIYTVPGTYTVILTVTDQNQIADPEVKVNFVVVHGKPKADFSIAASGCTLPVSASFTNLSNAGGTYTSKWDFGNGQTSTEQNPTAISYSTANSFTVSLQIENTTTGCKADTTITFTTSDFSAKFTVVDSVCVGSSVTMIDNSSVGANKWSWTSGAGSSSSAQNPSFTYNQAGTVTITLVAQNTTSGCSSTVTHDLVVVPKPTVDFTTTPSSGCIPLTVEYKNNTNSASSFTWDLGDGSPIFNGQTPPSHVYSTNGIFNVKLTATGVHGCVGSLIQVVRTSPVNANFIADSTSGCSPLAVQFTDLSIIPNPSSDPIVSWEWTFGNNATSTAQTPSSQVYTTGVYTVSLKITTKNGCTDTETKTKYIEVGKVDTVLFTYTPKTICAKSTVTFTNHSVVSAATNPNDIIYDWDFGDGGAHSALKDPTYSYPIDTGYFNVTLKVTFRGCHKSLKIDSAVYVNPPISKFAPSQTTFCNVPSFPVNVPVSDMAKIGRKNDDIKMIWRWGTVANDSTVISDHSYNSSSFDGNSSFNYPDYGTYDIKQVVYNYRTGCKDSTTQTITISKVDASFTLSTDSICKKGLVSATGSASTPAPATIVTYSYDMGNTPNAIFSQNVTNHRYNSASTYIVTFTATDGYGCIGTATKPVTVLEDPLAVISTPSGACAPIDLVFANVSTPQFNGYPTFASFEWTLPDGTQQTTTSLNETTHFLSPTPGNFAYKVMLVATDGFGCVSQQDTVIINVTLPTPKFTVDSVVCNKVSFTAANNTTSYEPTTYNWYLDNSTTAIDNTSNLSYTFNDHSQTTNTSHKLTMYATDHNGCVDSISKVVKVSIPTAQFAYHFTGANLSNDHEATCPPVFGEFTNQTSSYGTYSSVWEFGDGKSSTLKDPHNTFVFAGVYSGKLTITDQFGCKDDTIAFEYLKIGGPSIDPLEVAIGTVCDNLFLFDTINGKSVDHLLWDLGDGTTSTVSPVQHDYHLGGEYNPILTIYDDHNCAVPYPLTVLSLKDELSAYFVATPQETESGKPVVFDDQSKHDAPIVTWQWDFKDFDNTTTVSYTDVNPSMTYYEPYVYQVVLNVTDANGCKSTYTSPVHVTGDFKLPNVITPNGDGLNDQFEFYHDLFNSYSVTILNRWDNVVYEKENTKGIVIWDGTNKNHEQCTEGVYYYVIKGELKDGSPFDKVGFITKL